MVQRRFIFPVMLILLAGLVAISGGGVRRRESLVSAQPAVTTAIVGGTIIDGTGAAPRKGVVLIGGERIIAAGEGVTIPAGARVINAEGRFVMPGLFDLHTHLPYATAAGISGDWAKNLKAYLYSGVTSVVDFGTYQETFEPMRRLIREGVVIAPRISLAARLTTPGGHGAEGGRGDIFSLEVSTPDEARTTIRRLIPWHPDVIKVFTDGWRYGMAPDMTSMNEETLTALVDEAHLQGWKVLTHTVRLEQAKIAARSGVDVLVHGIGNLPVDRELIELLKAKGTTYVSTLAVYEPRTRAILTPLLATLLEPAVRERISPPLTAPETADGLIPFPPVALRGSDGTPRQQRWTTLVGNLAQLHANGVRLAVGTDAGVTGTHHGWATIRELELMVGAGMTPLEALTAATGTAAKALNLAGERGTIAAGKLADLLVVGGDPTRNISDLMRIEHLFLGGREIDRRKLEREIATREISRLPVSPAVAPLDDFERPDGRSSIDTLWTYSSDAGVDASKVIFGRIERAAGNQCLHAVARLSEKERPFIRLNLPLKRGAVEPVDARRFSGIEFDLRGEGDYRLVIPSYHIRGSRQYGASLRGTPEWKSVRIPFSSLTLQAADESGAVWSGEDLLMLSFEMGGKSRALRWIELDNVKFYQ